MSSSFSQFLKELPFLPKHFRTRPDPSPTSSAAATALSNITINVYEFEINRNESCTDLSKDDDSDKATTTSRQDSVSERILSSTTTLLEIPSLKQAPYTNIVVVCRKCSTEIPVRYFMRHRRRHEAMDILKYPQGAPPKTMRGLLRRRRKAIAEILERHLLGQQELFYFTNRINVAFEILKSEIEGTDEEMIDIPRWKEKNIKTEGKTFKSGQVVFGISKYRRPERGLSALKTVLIGNFLENQGIFFAIYQGYNGSYVAGLCARELHREIREKLQHSESSVKSAFQAAYCKIDSFQLQAEGEQTWKRWSGCSAVTCLLLGDVLYVANEGSVQGFLVRDNKTIRGLTSLHDLYNRKERLRVRRNRGVIVKTERCALVNGVLESTRGLGNQGDWRLKMCVINNPRFRSVKLKSTDKMMVLASEGIWKMFSFDNVLFLLRKFLRDASSKRKLSDERLATSAQGFLRLPAMHIDAEYQAYLRKKNVNPIDTRVPQFVIWNQNNPEIVVRRASVVRDEPRLHDEEENKKSYFTEAENNDEDLQQLSKIFHHFNMESSYSRREVAQLLSRRLVKSALLAGSNLNNVAIVLLLDGFDLQEFKYTL